MRVMKFGGSVLDDLDGLRQVAKIARAALERERGLVVVVSALKGVTDSLKDALDSKKKGEVRDAVKALRERHERVVAGLDAAHRKPAEESVRSDLDTLETFLKGAVYTGEVTPRTSDAVLAMGEKLSAPLVAAAMRAEGVEATSLDADEAGLLTDGRYGGATVNLERSQPRIQAALARAGAAVPVITGYFGRSLDGEITTLGRGGSDYSAAVFAYALGAKELVIWKDVPGIMSADPKLVEGAHLVRAMAYHEAWQLALSGAKVLHPKTLPALMLKQIPLRVKGLAEPEGPGTLVTGEHSPGTKAVTLSAPLVMLHISGGRPTIGSSTSAAALELLGEERFNVRYAHLSGGELGAALPPDEAEPAARLLRRKGVETHLVRGVRILTIVGDRPSHSKWAPVSEAVERAGCELVSADWDRAATHFLIIGESAQAVLREAHGSLFAAQPHHAHARAADGGAVLEANGGRRT
jgi:aspartate kinase